MEKGFGDAKRAAERVKLGDGERCRGRGWARGQGLKFVLAMAAAMLWQTGDLRVAAPPREGVAQAQAMKYERALMVPGGASGEACAVLDASVFAHAASAAAGDLRVVRVVGNRQQEIPFAVSFSEAQPTDAVMATAKDVRRQGGDLVFDLAMPKRAYTTVDLQLGAKDFVATAEVWGSDGKGGARKALGTFVLFDLTKEGLARSTEMALQESTFAELHVVLRVRGAEGGMPRNLPVSAVRGAVVPASREAQTLYTVVATSGKLEEQGGATVVRMAAAAHVPIERVKFVLQPGYKGSFLREVSVSAERDKDKGLREVVEGAIWRVLRSAGPGGVPAIDASKLAVGAVIASNMHEDATVTVAVKHGDEPPVPMQSVELEMRQRTVCFDAVAGARYVLRYGDDAAGASVYDRGTLARVEAAPLVATMGPEELNRRYVKRTDTAEGEERNPETGWILLLAGISVLGALASRHTKRRGRHR